MKRLLATYPNLITVFNHQGQNYNLPLAYIKERKWELAKLLLSAGWDPTKCPNGAAALENTLVEMATILENNNYSDCRKPSYSQKELPQVRDIIPFLLCFIPSLHDASQFQCKPHFEGSKLAHEILSHVL